MLGVTAVASITKATMNAANLLVIRSFSLRAPLVARGVPGEASAPWSLALQAEPHARRPGATRGETVVTTLPATIRAFTDGDHRSSVSVTRGSRRWESGVAYVVPPVVAPPWGAHTRGVDRRARRRSRPAPPFRRDIGGPARSAARATDEASADEARQRLREQGIVPIEPDERIGVLLCSDERVVAVRRAVSLERRTGWREPGGGLNGDFYVTTQRLIHLARVQVTYALGEVREAVVAGGALRLVVGESRGVEIDVGDPSSLRVEIAAAREAARAAAAPAGPLPEPGDPAG